MNIINENKTVGLLAEIVALKRGYAPVKAQQIRIAAALHDIDKSAIDNRILDSPNKLTPEEFQIVKTHTAIGAGILADIQGELGYVAQMTALYHHENESGTGYWRVPARYLPEYISIVSICDVFIALITSNRPYKDAWLIHDALAYIQAQAGTVFNAELTKLFVSLIQNDSRIANIF